MEDNATSLEEFCKKLRKCMIYYMLSVLSYQSKFCKNLLCILSFLKH